MLQPEQESTAEEQTRGEIQEQYICPVFFLPKSPHLKIKTHY
jgi:hypothetical protein